MSRFKNLLADVVVIPEFFEREHFPSLNGFRAVSVIIVVIFHLELSNGTLYQTIFNGSLGVNVFFVISGFLITSLLIKEKIKTAQISLRLFYIRRFLRILPAAYLCIVVVAVLNYFFHLHVNYQYLVAASLFIVNFEHFSPIKTPYVSHYWSLSVEEQFYILFPFIVKKNFKVFVLLILFIVFALPLIFTLQYIFPVLNRGIPFALSHFLIKFQGISVGCLFSVLCFKKIINPANPKYSLLIKLILTAAIFAIGHTAAITPVSVYTNLVISLLIGWLLILNLFYADDGFYKFLNFKVISQIGILSYSIYIWHLLILNLPILPGFVRIFPICLIIIFAVGWISYTFWEKPFLKLKSRFAVIKDKM